MLTLLRSGWRSGLRLHGRVRWPSALGMAWAEGWALLLVLGGLVWAFQGLRGVTTADTPWTQRYRLDAALQAGPLPATVAGDEHVHLVCGLWSQWPARLQWRWQSSCPPATRGDDPDRASGAVAAASAALGTTLATRVPAVLQADYQAVQAAIAAGERALVAQRTPWLRSQAEGVLPEAEQARLDTVTQTLALYRQHYTVQDSAADLAASAGTSAVLACAWAQLQARPPGPVVWANQLAVLRGQPGRLWWPLEADDLAAAGMTPACAAFGTPPAVLQQAAAQVQQVRQGARWARKAAAMTETVRWAPWRLVAWAGVCAAMLALVRRSRWPSRWGPVFVAVWAVVGWCSGLVLDSGVPLPWSVWGSMGVLALGWWAWQWRRAGRADGRHPPEWPVQRVTVLGYPLAVAFIGLGWWLVTDLSLQGHAANRYLSLSHARPGWGAFVLLSLMPVLAQGLADGVVRGASLLTNALRGAAGATGGRAWWRPAVLWGLYAVVLLGLAVAMRNWRQFTGEVFRGWWLPGMAWFFLLRAERWAQAARHGAWRTVGLSMLPLLGHAALVLLALLITDDQGPVLVVLLTSAVYAGALLAQTGLQRGAAWPAALLVGWLATLLVAGALRGVMEMAAYLPLERGQRVAERLHSVEQPFSAENDQLAHVLWFQQQTPPRGYGFGQVPWCGTLSAAAQCTGVPLQTQSDYTWTALWGVLGPWGARAVLIVYWLWLGGLAVRQAAQSMGRVAPEQPGATQAAWLAWLAVCWAVLGVVQSVVTVAGNLAWLPLTGVTWPFLSYGTWSLWTAAVFLGLALHRPQPGVTTPITYSYKE